MANPNIRIMNVLNPHALHFTPCNKQTHTNTQFVKVFQEVRGKVEGQIKNGSFITGQTSQY